MKCTIVDIETTGLSKHRHKITEIAAVNVVNGKIKKEFQTLVNPECHIPSFITRLTGIDDELVKDAPTIEDALPSFLKFLGDNLMVAHNATFDFGFLSHNARQLREELCNDTLCTKKLANRMLPDLPSKRLEVLCDHFNVKNVQAHRALADVHATHGVFTNMLQTLEQAGLKKQEEIVAFERAPVAKARKLLKFE